MAFSDRLLQFLIAIDQACNALIGSGFADETLSAFSHRRGGWRRAVVNGIFFWQEDHCKAAAESEVAQTQQHPGHRHQCRNPDTMTKT